jgi:hypothetical protein
VTVAISPQAESECDRSASDDRLGAEKAVIHYHLESFLIGNPAPLGATDRCLFWVISGNGVTPATCPFSPSKQTFVSASGTSVMCQ